jgi:large subunit ribosomal protein L33
MRTIIHFACGGCQRLNYSSTKNKTKTPEKMEKKKYCKFCKSHTLHKEKR